MPLSQTKRAISARQWRANKREKRRFNDLLSEYTNAKYKNVFDECKKLYESLNKAHSDKHDLTKTVEFKSWKTLMRTGNSSALFEAGQSSAPN